MLVRSDQHKIMNQRSGEKNLIDRCLYRLSAETFRCEPPTSWLSQRIIAFIHKETTTLRADKFSHKTGNLHKAIPPQSIDIFVFIHSVSFCFAFRWSCKAWRALWMWSNSDLPHNGGWMDCGFLAAFRVIAVHIEIVYFQLRLSPTKLLRWCSFVGLCATWEMKFFQKL